MKTADQVIAEMLNATTDLSVNDSVATACGIIESLKYEGFIIVNADEFVSKVGNAMVGNS